MCRLSLTNSGLRTITATPKGWRAQLRRPFSAGRSGGKYIDIVAGRRIAQEPGFTAGARVRS